MRTYKNRTEAEKAGWITPSEAQDLLCEGVVVKAHGLAFSGCTYQVIDLITREELLGSTRVRYSGEKPRMGNETAYDTFFHRDDILKIRPFSKFNSGDH